MSSASTIPVEITPETAARAEQLGIRRQLEEILEYTRQNVADLRSVAVTLYHDREEPGEPHLSLECWRDGPSRVDEEAWERWTDWLIRHYPPDVVRWLGFEILYRGEDDR